MKPKFVIAVIAAALLFLAIFTYNGLREGEAEDGFYITSFAPINGQYVKRLTTGLGGGAPPNPYTYFYHITRTQTSTKFRWVNWSRDGRYKSSYNALPHGATSRNYSFYIGNLGSITGTDYEMESKARSHANPQTTDTATHTLTVYRAEYNQQWVDVPDVGSVFTTVALDSIEYDDSTCDISPIGGYASVENTTNNNLEARIRFRFRVFDSNGSRIHYQNEYTEEELVEPGGVSSASMSDYIDDFNLGGYGDGDYTVDAMIRTSVSAEGSTTGYYTTIRPSGTITK